MTDYPALILVADEHSARFFVRPSRTDAIVEKPDYAETADLLTHGEHLPCRTIRTAGRLRVKPRSIRDQEELEIFLNRVADRANEAAVTEGIKGVAIVAPPPVMNGLRDFIASKTRERIVFETCHGMTHSSLAEIDAAMNRANV